LRYPAVPLCIQGTKRINDEQSSIAKMEFSLAFTSDQGKKNRLDLSTKQQRLFFHTYQLFHGAKRPQSKKVF